MKSDPTKRISNNISSSVNGNFQVDKIRWSHILFMYINQRWSLFAKDMNLSKLRHYLNRVYIRSVFIYLIFLNFILTIAEHTNTKNPSLCTRGTKKVSIPISFACGTITYLKKHNLFLKCNHICKWSNEEEEKKTKSIQILRNRFFIRK